MDDLERADLLLHVFLSRFFTIPARRPAADGMTFARLRVLWVLDRMRRAPSGEIARNIGISSSTATDLIDKLASEGYVGRERSSEDRRQVIVTLLPKGDRLMTEVRKRRKSRLQRLFAVLTREEVQKMIQSLEDLTSVVNRWEEREPAKDRKEPSSLARSSRRAGGQGG